MRRKPAGSKSRGKQTTGWEASEVRLVKCAWPVLDTPLALTVGKGGVGKTTISAALGFHARAAASMPVEICSVDPAPSLDDIFKADITDEPKPVLGDANFRASEMDSVKLFRNWADEIQQVIRESMTAESSSGVHVDLWFEREFLSRLLDHVPPGLDEVLAVFRILELLGGDLPAAQVPADDALGAPGVGVTPGFAGAGQRRVVIDMAPTGHALELLRTPERILSWTRVLLKSLAAHRKLAVVRDAGVKVAELGHRVRELLETLKSSQCTRIYMVMLAEPLPDRETVRLMNDLREMEMAEGPLFVNRVLFARDIGNCRRCGLARWWQQTTLADLRSRYPRMTLYAVRAFPREIAGKAALRKFTGELWRVA